MDVAGAGAGVDLDVRPIPLRLPGGGRAEKARYFTRAPHIRCPVGLTLKP